MKEYIVFDLEWNQSPLGKEGSIDQLPFEIIELGAVKLNEDFQVISEFHKLIRPQAYQEIHYKISEVTHMDISELENEGEDFTAVISRFHEWCGDGGIFCTWGSMDLTELQRNMAYHNIPIPYERPLLYYDIQKLYSLLFEDGKLKPSLDTAVESLGLLEERPFHRALDDAYYTGRVMAYMDFDRIKPYYSVDYYRPPQTKEEEIYIVFPDYSKFVSRTFDTKEEALEDKMVTDMVCFRCNRMLRKKIRWFSANQKIYFCLGICPEHGYLKGKIRMKKTDDGRIYVVKTIKMSSDEGANQIFQRKEDIKKKRTEKSRLRRLGKRNKH